MKRFLIRLFTPFFLVFGLHAVNGAEIPKSSKKLKFFSMDLHISVIADLRNIFEQMGHELVDWSISGHTSVFGKERAQVDVVNHLTWMDLDQEKCDAFYERYKDFFSQFDGFIVTHNASFALLYEKTNKPILVVNTTRYENPFTLDQSRWTWLNDYLKKGVENNRIFIVSNNKGDQGYLKYYTGLDSVHIPSLCLYTDAEYTGKKQGFIVHGLGGSNIDNEIKKHIRSGHKIANHLLPSGYKWQNLYDFQGVVHIPYNISTMSLFEQYSANVPLFLPSKKLLTFLYNRRLLGALAQLSFYQVYNKRPPNKKGDLNNILKEPAKTFWIEAADFYDTENMPYIQYFSSFAELDRLLESSDLQKISGQMKAYNLKRKQNAINKWHEVLESLIQSIDGVR